MIGNPMNNEQTNFKVTDRRLFNPDGTPREVPPEERPEPKPPAAAATSGVSSGRAEAQSTSDQRAQPEAASDQTVRPASATTSAASSVAPTAEATSNQAAQTAPAEATSSAAEEELLDAEDPAGFVNFIMSIASNAAASLGMMEHPVTHQREVDLELAKHWIDILGMLQKKTRGNLLPQEEKILEGLLADLRMQFVSHTSSATPKASRAYTGRDIVGG